jgi:hypothetical protein
LFGDAGRTPAGLVADDHQLAGVEGGACVSVGHEDLRCECVRRNIHFAWMSSSCSTRHAVNYLVGYYIQLATTQWGTVVLVVSAAPDVPAVQMVWSDFTDDDTTELLMRSGDDSGLYSFANGYLMHQLNLVETTFEDGTSALTIGPLFGPGVTQRTGRDEDGGVWRLGQRVVAPLAEALRRLDVDEVCLVVCGQLGQFPVHTAPLRAGAGAECLVDTVDVAFVPSARVLVHARARDAQQWPPATFGGLVLQRHSVDP